MKSNIWFTADLHFGHSRILEYSDRSMFGSTIGEHDKNMMEMWNDTVSEKDTVYMLGDIGLTNPGRLHNIINRLKGNKILIRGNHDKMPKHVLDRFGSVKDIQSISFKKGVYFETGIKLILCHYPILSWEGRSRGTCMIHGHCHGKMDEVNTRSREFRVDVGIDSKLAGGKLVSFQKLYDHMCSIKGECNFNEHINKLIEENKNVGNNR